MKRKRNLIFGVVLIGGLLSLAGCKSDEPKTTEAKHSDKFTKLDVLKSDNVANEQNDDIVYEEPTGGRLPAEIENQDHNEGRYNQKVDGGLVVGKLNTNNVKQEDVIVDTEYPFTTDISDYKNYTGSLTSHTDINCFKGDLRTKLVNYDTKTLISFISAVNNISEAEGMKVGELKLGSSPYLYSNGFKDILFVLFDEDIYLYLAINKEDYSVKYKIEERT